MALGSSRCLSATSPADCRQWNADDDKEEANQREQRHHGRDSRRARGSSGGHEATRSPENGRKVNSLHIIAPVTVSPWGKPSELWPRRSSLRRQLAAAAQTGLQTPSSTRSGRPSHAAIEPPLHG